jgi:hypothetical protein
VQLDATRNNYLHALGCSNTATGLLLGFKDFKKAYDSVRREVMYNILIEFRVPKKLG